VAIHKKPTEGDLGVISGKQSDNNSEVQVRFELGQWFIDGLWKADNFTSNASLNPPMIRPLFNSGISNDKRLIKILNNANNDELVRIFWLLIHKG